MPLRKKNILLLITNMDFGGAQRVFFNMAEELKNDYTIFECVFNKYEGVSYPTSNTLLDLNIPGSSNYILKIYYFILRGIKLRRIKKEYKIDICISHLEGADYVNILSKRDERTILWIHGSKFYDGEIRGWLGWVRKKILIPFFYNRADDIICVSRDIKEELINIFKLNANKIGVITNAFDVDNIYQQSGEEIEENYKVVFNNKVIITSGRLAMQKNQKALIKVYSLLKNRAGCKLVILGDGVLRERLIDECKSLNLKIYNVWQNQAVDESYDVYFFGYVKNPFKYIARSSLFVMTSGWEGFPMALGEAMACRVAVLSADCPTGPKEMLEPGLTYNDTTENPIYGEYGILMPLLTNNKTVYEIWVDTIDYVLSDKELSAANRIKDFGFQETILKWKQLINQ